MAIVAGPRDNAVMGSRALREVPQWRCALWNLQRHMIPGKLTHFALLFPRPSLSHSELC